MAGGTWAASLLPTPPGRNLILTSSFCCFEFEIKLEVSLKKKKKKGHRAGGSQLSLTLPFQGTRGRGRGACSPCRHLDE